MNENRGVRLDSPDHSLMHLDKRCRDLNSTVLVNSHARARRVSVFNDQIRQIIRRLKLHASTNIDLCPDNPTMSRSFTLGFKLLLTRTGEELWFSQS
jgi:hypothetical protein